MKNLPFKLLTVAFTLLCGLTLQTPLSAKAEDSFWGPTIDEQVYAFDTSVTLKMSLSSGSTYTIEFSTDKVNWISDEIAIPNDVDASMYFYDSPKGLLTGGTDYYVRIREKNSNTECCELFQISTAPSKVTNAHCAEQTDSSVKLSWTPSKGADYYEIRFADEGVVPKDAKFVGTVPTPYFDYDLSYYKNPNGVFYVIPYHIQKKEGKEYHWGTPYCNVPIKMYMIPTAPVEILVADRTYSSKLTEFRFDPGKANKIATHYELEIYDSKGQKMFTRTIDNDQYPIITIKNKALFQQAFQYRMRSGRVMPEDKTPTYGSWSEMKTFVPDAACKKLRKKSKKSAVLEFQKIKGAKYYTVYYHKPGGKFKVIVKKTKKTKVKVKYAQKKINYYYVVANKVKVGNKYVSSYDPRKNFVKSFQFK